MKILANSQDKAVGGIVRMMNTFVESVLKNDPNIYFHFAIASSSKTLKAGEKEIHTKTLHSFPVDCMVLPSDYYLNAIENSNSLEDLKDKLSDLVEFYLESIEKSKPDVVLINGTYYRPWALLQATRQKNIPYVVYVHGSAVQEARGLSSRTLSLLKEMEEDFYADNTHYIFPSTIAMKGVLFSSNLRPEVSHIIYNSLDDIFFTPKRLSNNNFHSVGFVLRWEEVKNIDFILGFIKFNRISLNPYRIKIVSDIATEKTVLYEDEFTEFLPPKTKTEMIKFYQEVDVIINPSFFETFGYVPAEAVAGGTTALVSPGQGIAEVFLKCGLERMISDFSDITAIYEKIPAIVRQGVSREEIENFRKELEATHLTKKILSVLSEAIN